MPELPEVETMARDIRPHLAGRTIRKAHLYKPDVLRKIKRPAFERGLAGRRVRAVGRRAKHVVIELDDGRRLIVQPRMTGSFGVRARGREGRGREDYIVFELHLDSGETVYYRDVRRLGAVFLIDEKRWADYDCAIGPEPLDPSFTAARMTESLKGGKAAIKKALMDQRRIAGVGNIYANEALWMAGIDPSRETGRIKAEEMARIHGAVVDVLRKSIEGRGTTIRDYRTGTGGPGSFQGRLAVYGREGEPCLRCRRKIVLTHAIDARATYFCPGCQH